MRVGYTSTKSQIFSIDFIIAVSLFLIVAVLVYYLTIDLYQIKESEFDKRVANAKLLSSELVSSGYPSGWKSGDVVKIGLTDGEFRLNISKLKEFSSIGYSNSKRLLSSNYDYYVYFEYRNGSQIEFDGIEGIGKPGVTKDNLVDLEKPKHLVKIYRFLFYNSEIIRMVIYVW